MIIERNGELFTLTSLELNAAYNEQLRGIHLEDAHLHVTKRGYELIEKNKLDELLVAESMAYEYMLNLIADRYDQQYSSECDDYSQWEDAVEHVITQLQIRRRDKAIEGERE